MAHHTLATSGARRALPKDLIAAAIFAVATFTAAGIGSVATSSTVESAWFDQLEKPSFYPPGSAFGIVWTVLYVMIAVSGWRAWRSGADRMALGWWAGQLALNLAWSVVFFGLRRPGLAVAVIAALAVAIVGTIVAFRRHDRPAAWLLAPYLAWVAFASALNVAIATAS